MYYLGFVGSRSFTNLNASSTSSFLRLEITMLSLVYGNKSKSGGKVCIAFYPFLKTTTLCLNKSLSFIRSPPLNFCRTFFKFSSAFLPL